MSLSSREERTRGRRRQRHRRLRATRKRKHATKRDHHPPKRDRRRDPDTQSLRVILFCAQHGFNVPFFCLDTKRRFFFISLLSRVYFLKSVMKKIRALHKKWCRRRRRREYINNGNEKKKKSRKTSTPSNAWKSTTRRTSAKARTGTKTTDLARMRLTCSSKR